MKLMARYSPYAFALAVILWLAISCLGASTFGEYRQRVLSARNKVDELFANDRRGPRDLGPIKELLPKSEILEQDGDRIETSNAWFADELDRFAAEPDSIKRIAILTGIRERLTSIETSIAELGAAKANTTKDDEKQKLADILSRPEYQKPEAKEESLFQKWYREFQEWLDRVFPRPDISPAASPSMGSIRLWLQVLIFAVVIGLVGFLIYKFVPLFGRRFRKGKGGGRGDQLILGERIESHESAGDLFAEAERLAREGELRAAIRKGYVALLIELADRKVIGLARHKTNRDYLRDVRRRGDLVEGVSGLTLNFERSWYGLRPADAADWEAFRDGYRETMRKV
jgi:hypothetical protein